MIADVTNEIRVADILGNGCSHGSWRYQLSRPERAANRLPGGKRNGGVSSSLQAVSISKHPTTVSRRTSACIARAHISLV